MLKGKTDYEDIRTTAEYKSLKYAAQAIWFYTNPLKEPPAKIVIDEWNINGNGRFIKRNWKSLNIESKSTGSEFFLQFVDPIENRERFCEYVVDPKNRERFCQFVDPIENPDRDI